MHMLMPVDEIRRAAEGGDEGLELGCDLDASALRRQQPQQAPRTSICSSGRNAPSRSGAKPALSGLNGAVSVTCSPIATRAAPALSTLSDAASERLKLGATTITEVALSRPRTIRSRIAR